MNLQETKSKPIETTFHFRGQALNLAVDVDMITPNFLEGMKELVQSATAASKPKKKSGDDDDGLAILTLATQNNNFMAETLSRVITNWDLKDGDTSLPISVPTFKQLPQVLLTELFQFVLGVSNPEPKTGPNSVAS